MKHLKYLLFTFSLMLVHAGSGVAQDKTEAELEKILNGMSLDEKIGQLLWVRAFSKSDDGDVAHVTKLITDHHVGGICFFQGSPVKQAQLTNIYQKIAKTPLAISIDGEWGLGMRFKDQAISFPRNLMLGAIQDEQVVYELGREIGKHCKRIGININFAPVVDINNNPDNPVINDRSFGEDKHNVIAKSTAYMTGLQDAGVMACAKHFPGHGDTDVDSHYDLPIINHTLMRLDSVELVPFKSMISEGIGSIMIAHLNIPALDDRPNRPTTLSHKTVTELLREEMAYNGLIITDAMEMKGVTKHFQAGEADAEAFLAGVDVILLPEDVPAAVKSIKQYIKDGKISLDRLNNSVRRILRAKNQLGLFDYEPIEIKGLSSDINSRQSLALKERLVERAITLARDSSNLIPIGDLQSSKIATIAIGANASTPFQNTILKYIESYNLFTTKDIASTDAAALEASIEKAETVVISLHDMSKYSSRNFGLTTSSIDFIKRIAAQKKVILVVFGSPYALKYFEDLSTVVVSYNEEEVTQEITAQSLFGANAISGKLPVTASPGYRAGQGLVRASIGRLGFSIPERVGINSVKLREIDDLVEEMIQKKAAPGGQVFIAKDQKVIWNKAYGTFTYDTKKPVSTTDLYDMASVTKIAATTVSLMHLYDQGKFDLNAPVVRYLPESATSNKAAIKMKQILSHHARLIPWIPFYKKTIYEDAEPGQSHGIAEYYSRKTQPGYTIPVTESMYIRNDYIDSMYTQIYESELRSRNGYRYSDLGFILLTKIIEKQADVPLDLYVNQNFYGPLGLRRTGFNPMLGVQQSQIAPSEEDTYFRDQVIQGTVHDMASAMMGGVSGHAGLFSNAYETGIIMQMLLNGGYYGGVQFLKPSTVKLFTTRYPGSTRRGLGFDMKELNQYNHANMGQYVSRKAFGHSGFTGIHALADPEHNLVIVIVTNRTYPTMDNRTFIKNDYRPKIQDIVYEAMNTEWPLP